MRKTAKSGTTPKSMRAATPRRGGDIDVYEAAGADLLVARRSSIRSRSTSQYLSAESRSLSCWSPWRDSSVVDCVRSTDLSRLFAVCVWILLVATFRVAVCAAPVTIFPSFVLLPCNSHHNSGAAVTKSFRLPIFQQRRRPRSFASLAGPIRTSDRRFGVPVKPEIITTSSRCNSCEGLLEASWEI